MTAVRPPLFPPVAPAAGGRADPAKLAAQKAFFEAALGKTAVAAPPSLSPNAPAPVAAAARTPDQTSAAQTRILRPGSLLDIRV